VAVTGDRAAADLAMARWTAMVRTEIGPQKASPVSRS
jgi:hypothetical protein